MRNLYDHHFTLKPGTCVYVPTTFGRTRGKSIKEAIEKIWTAPDCYYHLKAGGHVAAVRHHHEADWLASLDLQRFFDQITRSKVHRALKAIGIPHVEAWEMACDSTVDKQPPRRQFSLPFGFVQSPIIASVVLAKSALGAAIRRLQGEGVEVTVYVDDIVVSSSSKKTIKNAVLTLEEGADVAGFAFNPDKLQTACRRVTNFNIEFGSGTMAVVDDRMAEFEHAIQTGNEYVIEGIIGYVSTVNILQGIELSKE